MVPRVEVLESREVPTLSVTGYGPNLVVRGDCAPGLLGVVYHGQNPADPLRDGGADVYENGVRVGSGPAGNLTLQINQGDSAVNIDLGGLSLGSVNIQIGTGPTDPLFAASSVGISDGFVRRLAFYGGAGLETLVPGFVVDGKADPVPGKPLGVGTLDYDPTPGLIPAKGLRSEIPSDNVFDTGVSFTPATAPLVTIGTLRVGQTSAVGVGPNTVVGSLTVYQDGLPDYQFTDESGDKSTVGGDIVEVAGHVGRADVFFSSPGATYLLDPGGAVLWLNLRRE